MLQLVGGNRLDFNVIFNYYFLPQYNIQITDPSSNSINNTLIKKAETFGVEISIGVRLIKDHLILRAGFEGINRYISPAVLNNTPYDITNYANRVYLTLLGYL